MIWLIVAAIAAVLIIRAALPMINSAKAEKALAGGDGEKAEEYLKKAASSGKAGYKIKYALFLMRGGKFSEAEKLLNEVILFGGANQNEKVTAKLYRCIAYQKTDRLDEALEDIEEIFEVFKNTAVYGMICYLKQLKGGAELELCLEAYDYNSDDRDICDNLAVAYIRSGKIDEAEEITADLRERFPSFAEGFYHSAVAAKLRGDKAAAIEYLNGIENCRRNMMTTVSQEEIDNLREELENA